MQRYQRSRTSSIGVYPVQPDGSRPRENVFTIYENKRICPKQSKFGVDEQSLRDAGYHRRSSIDLEAYAKLQNIQNYVSLSTTSFRNSCFRIRYYFRKDDVQNKI
jgi:hypothetical protein